MSVSRSSHQNWAVAAITTDKNNFAAQRPKWQFPSEWGNLAVHHQISKVYLERLGKEVSAIIADQKADGTLKKAAQAFWQAVQDVVPKEIKQQANNQIVTLLWNMPVNLEIGPDLVSNNPGIGFDPNTEPLEDGRRKLSNVSVPLQQLERTYLKATRRGQLTATDLSNMAGNLTQAQKNFLPKVAGNFLAAPSVEQWVVDAQLDVRSLDKFQRKGLKMFLGTKEGKNQFTRSQEIGASPNDIAPFYKQKVDIARITVNYTLSVDNRQLPITIKVAFQQEALHHICVRHTYAYFDKTQAKVVNSFWPDPRMSYSDVRDWVRKVLPSIGIAGGDYLQGAASAGDILSEIDISLRGQNIRIDDTEEMLYFIASLAIEDIDGDGVTPISYLMEVDTATLDAGAHAYTRSDLQQIFS